MLVTFYNDEAEHIKTNTTTIWHYTIEWEKKRGQQQHRHHLLPLINNDKI